MGDVSSAIGTIGRAGGYGINADFGGHGVGRTMHEDPHVPNLGRPGTGLKLKAGLVIAIEPWFMAGGDEYTIDAGRLDHPHRRRLPGRARGAHGRDHPGRPAGPHGPRLTTGAGTSEPR